MEITPNIFLRPVRRGASTIGVPMPINEKKQFVLATKWVLGLLKKQNSVIKRDDVVELLYLATKGSG
jgi:ribosomal protein S7